MGTNFPEVGKFYVISWYNEIPTSTWLQNTGRAIYFVYVGIITSTRQGRRYVALVHTDLTVLELAQVREYENHLDRQKHLEV